MAIYPDSLLILNGKSAGNDLLRQAVMDLREDGARIHVRVTWEKGDAARYIDEGLKLGVETIISGGGDGTINEIAGALIDLPATDRPVMGILPLGTANDFATSAGIPEELGKALQLAILGKATAVDIAQVNEKPVLLIWRPVDSGRALPAKPLKS